MAYTDQDIKGFIDQKGIGNNPYAMYNYAKQYGVAPGRIDQVMGYATGTSDKWIQQQGLQGLAGGAVGGTAPTSGNYSSDQIRQFITDKGISDNPQAMYAYAQQYGGQPGQVDQALGAQAGQSANWIQQQGLNPILQAQSAQPAQQTGMPPMGQYQQNPTANPYMPMAGGGMPMQQPMPQPQMPQQQQPTQQVQQNPYTQQIADRMTQQVTNNLTRNVLPNIRRGQVANGTLGSTRQGIAEGLAIGDTNDALSGALGNLYAGQFNADRNYGLSSDALDLSAYNANQNWMRQGQQDQLGLADRMLGWNQQYGVGNATQVQNAPMNYWQGFGNQASQFAGLGGQQTQNMQGNPYLGALGGALTGAQLWKGFGG